MAAPQKPPKLGMECEKDDDSEGGLEVCTFTCDKGFQFKYIFANILLEVYKKLQINNINVYFKSIQEVC